MLISKIQNNKVPSKHKLCASKVEAQSSVEKFKGTSKNKKKHTQTDWNKLNFLQRSAYGATYFCIGLGSILMALIMPKKELGSTLAFKRGKKSFDTLEDELKNHLEGNKAKPKSNQEQRSEAWSAFQKTNMSVIFSYLASKNLATATVHLDPSYKLQSKPKTKFDKPSKELKENEKLNMGFLGHLGNKLLRWSFEFQEKYDLYDDCDYFVPDSPIKLSLFDKFFLKHYFKTKPSWEYSENERKLISEKCKKRIDFKS